VDHREERTGRTLYDAIAPPGLAIDARFGRSRVAMANSVVAAEALAEARYHLSTLRRS
jgi:hypothetical protein